MGSLILIGGLVAVWLVFTLICIGLCVSAARGDRALRLPVATLRARSAPRRLARRMRSAA